MEAGSHPCPQSRVPGGGPGDWHRRTGDFGVMYRGHLVPNTPGALVPAPYVGTVTDWHDEDESVLIEYRDYPGHSERV